MSQSRFRWIACGAPAVRGSATSEAAGRRIDPIAVGLRARVYQAIQDAGAEGATDHELEVRTGIGGSTCRPRRIELQRLGLIRDSGTTRPTPSGRVATVWVTTK